MEETGHTVNPFIITHKLLEVLTGSPQLVGKVYVRTLSVIGLLGIIAAVGAPGPTVSTRDHFTVNDGFIF